MKTTKADAVNGVKSRVVWERSLDENRPGFRIVADGSMIMLEQARSRDALGIQQWRAVTFSELPGEGMSFLSTAALNGTKVEEAFAPELDERTPRIVRQLAGQPITFAAEMMALALDDKKQGTEELLNFMVERGHKRDDESAFAAAIRTITELSSTGASIEAELTAVKKRLAAALDGADELIEKIVAIQLGIADAGIQPPITTPDSLCRQATALLVFLVRSLIVTDVQSVTRTVVTQRPVFPGS